MLLAKSGAERLLSYGCGITRRLKGFIQPCGSLQQRSPGGTNGFGWPCLFQTATAATAAGDGTDGLKSGNSSSTKLTEQQLAELFDEELQRRLDAATRKSSKITAGYQLGSERTVVGGQQLAADLAPAPGSATEPPAGSTATGQQHEPTVSSAFVDGAATSISTTGLSPSTAWRPSVQPLASRLPPPSNGWTPLSSTDPWAPLPSVKAARQRLPDQVVALLCQAGFSEAAAAHILQRLSSPIAPSSSSSSDGPNATVAMGGQEGTAAGGVQRPAASSAGHSPDAVSHGSGAASTAALSRKLFGPPDASAQQHLAISAAVRRPRHQQQQRHENPVQGLSRLQTKQLVHLMEECQAPTYGGKQVLVQRLALLLQEQSSQHSSTSQGQEELQQQQQQLQPGQGLPIQQEQVHEAGGPKLVQQQQQQQQRRQWRQPASRQPPDMAAKERLLQSVLDVGQVGQWLLAARAQDVCIIDVRGRAGLQAFVVVASGVNQRHTRALAEAVAWQLLQAAQEAVQQRAQLVHSNTPDVRQLLPPLNVVGDGSSEWCVLDAGSVTVHVLTQRARRFYALEAMWGGAQGRFIKWLKPERPALETKDTIGKPTLRL